jgi:Ca2+-binding RTX toxin-like protein
MTDYVFDSSNSQFGGIVFNDPNPGTLKVKADGYFISTTGSDDAFTLGGNWVVSIFGAIGTYVSGMGALTLSSAGLTTLSSVTVGAGGDIFGDAFGVFANSRTNIVNKGSIVATGTGAIGILESNNAIGDYKITNSGKIFGDSVGLQLDGAGVHTIVNAGTIFGNDFSILGQTSTFVGIEHVTNSGIIGGIIQLGLGDDVFTDFAKVGKIVKHGHVSLVDLGDGNDVFNGGKFLEGVRDGPGTDSYKLGAGNDFFLAQPASGASGDDFVNAGPGSDTYTEMGINASSATIINLDSVAHDGHAAQSAVGGVDIGTDKIIGFENATGGQDEDLIYGTAGANLLVGADGNDVLLGLGGADHLEGGDDFDLLEGGAGNDELHGGLESDTLYGDAGNDTLFGDEGGDSLIGGVGKDLLFGGADADYFALINTLESGVGAANRDVVEDFVQGTDKISLNIVDAITTNGPGDDSFTMIGLLPFSHTAGELRFAYVGGSTILEGDVNGDAKADFQMELLGHFMLSSVNNVDVVL